MTKSAFLIAAALMSAQSPDLTSLEKAATTAVEQFDFETAVARYRDLLTAQERQHGANSVAVARTLLKAAVLPGWTGAAESFQRSADIFQAAAPGDPGLAEALYRTGVEAQVARNEAAARERYERALAATRASGADTIAARVRHNLAMMASQSDPAQAEAWLQQEIETEQKLGGGARLAAALHSYAALLRTQGRTAESEEQTRRAGLVRGQLPAIPPVQPSEGVFRVGGDVAAPKLEAKLEPEYSAEARAARYQGTVVLAVEIGPDGRARRPRIVRPLGFGLDEQAAWAVQQWRFQPGTKDGQPVTVAATIEVNFRLL